jgi:hypothetical protein
MKRIVSSYLDENWIQMLDEIADKTHMFRSALIAGMLREKISEVWSQLNPVPSVEEIQATLPQVPSHPSELKK